MSVILGKVVASQRAHLEPDETYRAAAKVRIVPVAGSRGARRSGLRLPESMIWAVSDRRLFLFTCDRVTGGNPRELLGAFVMPGQVQLLGYATRGGDLVVSTSLEGFRVDVRTAAPVLAPLVQVLQVRAPQILVPAVDPYSGDERARVFDLVLRNTDWVTAERLFHEAPTARDREFLLSGSAGVDAGTGPDGADAWVEARAGSPAALLVRGAAGIAWAWQARGAGWARTVAPEAWDVFHGRLRDAEADLLRAAEAGPTDGLPWALLVTTGMGLGIPLEEVHLRFGESVRRTPELRLVHFRMLRALQRRWLGSHEEMYAFARAHADAAPDGSSLHALVAAAHLEEKLDADPGEPSHDLREPEVRAEILECAQRSVLHPSWVDAPYRVPAMNIVACALLMADERDLARVVTARIGPRRTLLPWAYWPDADRGYAAALTGG